MKKNVMVALGLILATLGFKIALLPFNINVGGFAGISQIIHHFTAIPYSLSSALQNLGFFAWAYRRHGRKDVLRAVVTTMLFGVLLDQVLQVTYSGVTYYQQVALVCIAAVVTGLGFGLIIRGDSSTGGSDYLAEIITLKFPSLSRGAASTIINIIIVCSTAYLFGIRNFTAAVIATILVNESVNVTLYVGSSNPLPRSIQMMVRGVNLVRSFVDDMKCRVLHTNVKVPALSFDKDQVITMRSGDQLITLRVIDIRAA